MARNVEIIQRQIVFKRFIFEIEELVLRYEKFDRTMSASQKRLVLNRGDAAAVLLHDPVSDLILLCEQFRAPTIKNGSGWILELPAGMIEGDEAPEACVRREAVEETGQAAENLVRIATVYASPGGSSERLHILSGTVTFRSDLPATAGLEEEGEDIRTVLLPVSEALSRLEVGSIEDAKTVIALQWLALQRARNTAKVNSDL